MESEFFSVFKWDVREKSKFSLHNQYLLLSVIKGDGALIHDEERYPLIKGTHLIIPVGFGEFAIDGVCQLIVSHP